MKKVAKIRPAWMICGLIFCGVQLMAQGYVSKWDRVQTAAQGIASGTVVERLQNKEAVVQVLLSQEAGYPLYYVDQNATGLNDGSSWQNAFTTIQPAIDQATQSEGWVWVAQGTYTGSVVGVDKGEYVAIGAVRIKPRVMLFGGFSGGEETLSARDPEANRTIIQGQIGPMGPRAVYMDHETLIDGFDLRNSGFQNYTSWADYASGGGLRCGNWLAVIRNNRIYGNYGKGGAGLAVWNRDGEYNVDGFSPIIDQNYIYDNCGVCGAGVQIRNAEALFCHNTVTKNWHSDKAKGVEIVIIPAYSAVPFIVNNIIWDNSDWSYPDLYNHVDNVAAYGDAAKAVSYYNCIKVNGYAVAGLITSDPQFDDADHDDFGLRSGSPCIDAGHPEGPNDADGSRADMGVQPPANYGQLSGVVRYGESGRAVSDVSIHWQEAGSTVALTNANGAYVWESLQDNSNMTVFCQKADASNEDPQVVSAYDAALVARYCVGNLALSAWERRAGDVNSDGNVNWRDAFSIARHAVGLSAPESQCGSWQFSPENRFYSQVVTQIANEDYTAVVMGDVNLDWNAGQSGKRLPVSMAVSMDAFHTGKDSVQLRIVLPQDKPLWSFDLAVADPAGRLELLGVDLEGGLKRMQKAVNRTSGVRLACFSGEAVVDDAAALTLYFRMKSPVSALEIRHLQLNAERDAARNIAIKPGAESGATAPVLKGNYPNPFNPSTAIVYAAPKGHPIQIELLNAIGRRLRRWSLSASQCREGRLLWDGRDEEGNDLPSGIYFCVMTSGAVRQVKKMIKLK